jgi:hypothetical protein
VRQPWLVSARFDLWAFGAPAAVALLLVPAAAALEGEVPLWAWALAVVGVDVAHVWSTLYRTYLDPAELRRRPALYAGAPLVAYGAGVALASASEAMFWRGLAYVAVFHFVRQQYGWVRLYGQRDPGLGPSDRRLDAAAIYAATVYPLLWWHAHLPRRFEWFAPGDFVGGLPGVVAAGLAPLYVTILAGFLARQVQRGLREGFVPWGKVLVVLSTAACWGIGIVLTDSDWAFTMTNVLVHGVPYVAFVWLYGRRTYSGADAPRLLGWLFGGRRWLVFLLVLVALAYGEEYLWDRSLWHERGALFWGPAWAWPEGWVRWWMPLLAVPQLTHYLLDGFIWRTREARNPALSRVLAA